MFNKFYWDKIPKLNLSFVFVISVALQFFPLVNVTSYEYSVVISLCLFLSSGLYVTSQLKGKDDSFLNQFIFSFPFWQYIIISFLIPIIPSFISTIFIEGCPFFEGLFFYLLFVLPVLFWGILLAIISVILEKRFRKSLFLFLFFIILILPFLEIYLNPQIYLYHSIFGFFPGTIYDEDISLDKILIGFRISVLIFSVMGLISLKVSKTKKIRISRVFGIGILALSLFYLKSDMGLATNIQRMKSKLGKEVETEHFRIIYSDQIDSSKIFNLVLHHEYYYDQISKQLNDTLDEKITSIVFYNGDQKRKLFGAKNADVAKPWLYQIYTDWEHYDISLKHEIAHIFSANYGVTPFKIAKNFNPAMIEGFAMALENNYNNQEIHSVVKNAYDSGYKTSIKNLFSGFNFFGQNPSISYVYAGSFVKFLLNKYGAESIKKVYGDLDFKTHYNKSIDSLEHEYLNFLDSIKSKPSKEKANIYFGRKPMFKKYCVRSAANKTKRTWSIYYSGAYEEALNSFEELYFYSGAYSPLIGQIVSLQKLDRFDDALDLLKRDAILFEGTAYYSNLQYRLAGLYVYNDQENLADSIYSEIIKLKPSIEYSNLSILRKDMIQDSTLKNYLSASSEVRYKLLCARFYNTPKAEYITPLISLYLRINEDYNQFIDKFKNVVFDSTFVSAYSALELSKICKDNYDYKAAMYYLNIALRYTENSGFVFILNQYKKKLEWLKNNYKQMYYSDLIKWNDDRL